MFRNDFLSIISQRETLFQSMDTVMTWWNESLYPTKTPVLKFWPSKVVVLANGAFGREWVMRKLSWVGLVSLQERPQWALSLFLPHEDIRRSGPSGTWMRLLTTVETQPCWHPDLGSPESKTVRNKCWLFKPPGLWYMYSKLAKT